MNEWMRMKLKHLASVTDICSDIFAESDLKIILINSHKDWIGTYLIIRWIYSAFPTATEVSRVTIIDKL